MPLEREPLEPHQLVQKRYVVIDVHIPRKKISAEISVNWLVAYPRSSGSIAEKIDSHNMV